MSLVISDQIAEKYPDLRIGILIGRKISNKKMDAGLEKAKTEAVEKLRSQWSIDTIASHPFIEAWRDTYRSFGVKPKDYMPTAESLIRRVLKENPLPTISVVVDTYLVNELEHFLPIGGYDMDCISGDILLRFAQGGEEFIPLGGGSKTTKSGEVVYSDAKRVLTVRWNYLDCDTTKITEKTTNLGLFIEAADSRISDKALSMALDDLVSQLKKFCPGQYYHQIARVSDGLKWTL